MREAAGCTHRLSHNPFHNSFRVGDLLRQYYEGKISADQFVQLSLLIASESAIVGLASAAGQALIPIPVLGAFIGSIAGKFLASTLKNALGNSGQELISRFQVYERSVLEQLDEQYRSLLFHINEYFENLEQLLKASFDETLNASLRPEASIRFAECIGVPDDQIIRSTDSLDQFMME